MKGVKKRREIIKNFPSSTPLDRHPFTKWYRSNISNAPLSNGYLMSTIDFQMHQIDIQSIHFQLLSVYMERA